MERIKYHIACIENIPHLLSVRELEVLELIANGNSTCMIADMLYISRLTVDTHRKNMLNKMEANNSPHLVALAKDRGLI